jgi:RNA polymerase sigma factor (sigma-70 family)
MSQPQEDIIDDKRLVDRVLRGDVAAFGLIIKQTERLVTQIIFKMINHVEDRKDLVQDIYLKAFNSLASFRFKAKLSTWIAQIAYNACFDYLKKKKLILPGNMDNSEEEEEGATHFISVKPIAEETSAILSQKELTGILQAAIEKLSPIYKTLVVLYHSEELSYEEIVQITGLPEGTVKSYLYRARKTLKDNLSLRYKKEEL